MLHLWLNFITFMVGRLLHLWLNVITFMVGITFMVVTTFMGDTRTPPPPPHTHTHTSPGYGINFGRASLFLIHF